MRLTTGSAVCAARHCWLIGELWSAAQEKPMLSDRERFRYKHHRQLPSTMYMMLITRPPATWERRRLRQKNLEVNG